MEVDAVCGQLCVEWDAAMPGMGMVPSGRFSTLSGGRALNIHLPQKEIDLHVDDHPFSSIIYYLHLYLYLSEKE